jgi:hypothetical protein
MVVLLESRTAGVIGQQKAVPAHFLLLSNRKFSSSLLSPGCIAAKMKNFTEFLAIDSSL